MKRVFLILALALMLVPYAANADLNVWFLVGDVRSPEGTLISENITEAGGMLVHYETQVIQSDQPDVIDLASVTMSDLADVDVLWFTWNGPGHDSTYFMGPIEQLIKDWVQAGGLVWISAFDDNYVDANGNQVGGWMPIDQHPTTISNTGDSDVQVTAAGEASGLFAGVDLASLVLDDNFATSDTSYEVLATRADNGEIAAFKMSYGKGMYLEMCVDTRDEGRTTAALPLFQNALNYFADYLANQSAVDAQGKLTTTWAGVKQVR